MHSDFLNQVWLVAMHLDYPNEACSTEMCWGPKLAGICVREEIHEDTEMVSKLTEKDGIFRSTVGE